MKLENGDEYELKGGETVSIEDGVLFVDHSPDPTSRTSPTSIPTRRRRRERGVGLALRLRAKRKFAQQNLVVAVGDEARQRRRAGKAMALVKAQRARVERRGADPEIARPMLKRLRFRTRP